LPNLSSKCPVRSLPSSCRRIRLVGLNTGFTAKRWSGNRWWATHTSPRRDGTGFRQFRGLCCGARLAALTFPPSPPSSPALRERKGAGGSGSERTLAPPHAIVARERTGERGDGSASILATSYAMVARARYVPDETFLIRLYAPIRKIPIRRSPHPISTSLARRGSLIHCFSLNLI